MMPNNERAISSGSINHTAPFIGRSVELERLLRMLTSVDERHAQTVLITGEEGIGKTRLAQEVANHAKRSGWQVWKGHADAMNNKIPFSTLVQVFRTAISQLSSEERVALATAVPNVSLLFPGFDESKPEMSSDIRWDRIQLFETFRSMAMHLVQERPTVVWFDDFPESDTETMDWLHYFVRHEEQVRILFLATCRTPMKEVAPEYRNLCETLIRHHQLEEITLRPLGLRETGSLARGLVVGDVQERMLRVVQDRTKGIPLFAIELIRMLRENGRLFVREGKWDITSSIQQQVPSVVTAVFSQRIAHLSELQRQLLDYIAISDGPLPWSILQKSTGVASQSLATSLSRLVQLAIVDENPISVDIVYSLAHPMMQEVVLGEISVTTSRHLHRVLATSWSENPVRAAYHILRSGSMADVREAVELLVDAGGHHLSMRAYQAAREHLEMAVEMIETSTESVAPELEQDAKMLLCEAWAHSERVSDALTILEDLNRQTIAAPSKIRIKRLMATIESTRFVANCIQHIEDGLLSWDGQSASEDVFWMLNEQVFNYLNSDAITEAERILGALRHYCELHPSPKHSLVLSIREAHIQLFDWRKGQRQVPDAGTLISRARALGDPEWIYDSYGLLGYSSLNQGDHRTTVRYWRECLPLVQRYGMATYEYALTIMGACGLFLAGDWDEALAELDLVEQMAREYAIDLALAAVLDQKAVIYALRGQWSKARSCTTETREVAIRSLPSAARPTEAHRVHAVTALQMIAEGVAASVPDFASVVWANIHGLPIFLKLLEGMIQVRSGNAHTAERLIHEVQQATGDDINYAKGVALLLTGLVDNHRGEVSSAMARIEGAIQTFEFLGIPLESALSRLEWSAIAALKQPEHAEVSAQAALSVFQKLDAQPFVERSKRLLQTIHAHGMETGMDVSVASLSTREREVVSCIAKGLSNKEIAETLVLSRRTVDAHLNKIYKKFGVHSRTALLHALNLR